MPLFRCIICGENFPGTLLGQEELVGFYTTRFVEADSPEQAEIMAIELLRNDPSLDVSSEHRTQSAKVFFEDIDEVPGDTEQKPNSGFTFRSEEHTSELQSLMRISYAVFCLKKKTKKKT